ncbi:glycoside hydrolase [Amylocystis lapponica]|nr:glycoside hydrolase [Amylocystis lapponica]
MSRYAYASAGVDSNPDLRSPFAAESPTPSHRLSGPYDPYASSQNLAPVDSAAAMPHAHAYSNMDAPYSNQEYSSSQWLEKQQAGSRKSKCIVVGSIVTLLILIGAGVGVGIGLTRHSSSAATSKSGKSSSNDPSSFALDPNLFHSFYGMAYTPSNSQLPDCGNSLEDVIEDIQLISQLTSRIHLYGADCNQSALVLEAIKQTKVNMSVYLAIYNVPTNATAYLEQRDLVLDAVKTYGTDHILGISVGNEFILDYLGDYNGGNDPNGAVGNQGAQMLISNITDTRQQLSSMGVNLPVGTADAGAYFNTEVLQSVDYAMSNVHPWFANVSAEESAGWTYEFFQDNNVQAAQAVSNKPAFYIGETGWPSSSTNIQNESNGPSNASIANFQIFLDTYVCQSNTNGTGYFFFEYMDETWQALQFGGVEGSWGLYYANKTMKPLTIPNCHID